MPSEMDHDHRCTNVIFLKLASEVVLWEGWVGGWPANEEGWTSGFGAGGWTANEEGLVSGCGAGAWPASEDG